MPQAITKFFSAKNLLKLIMTFANYLLSERYKKKLYANGSRGIIVWCMSRCYMANCDGKGNSIVTWFSSNHSNLKMNHSLFNPSSL